MGAKELSAPVTQPSRSGQKRRATVARKTLSVLGKKWRHAAVVGWWLSAPRPAVKWLSSSASQNATPPEAEGGRDEQLKSLHAHEAHRSAETHVLAVRQFYQHEASRECELVGQWRTARAADGCTGSQGETCEALLRASCRKKSAVYLALP